MEVANILDIDGTQWEIQDGVARNQISMLKSEMKYKIVITREIFDSDIALTDKSVAFPAYYRFLKLNSKPNQNAILLQVSQIMECYQGLIISLSGKDYDLMLSSMSQMIIPKGFALECFWLTPITE